jgi:uncharacterized protein (DUF2141 family)
MRAAVLKKRTVLALLFGLAFIGASTSAFAQTLGPQQRMCDPTFEDCRADILTYIQQETVEIDMGFWMMTDARYSNALVAAWQRGVKIRLLMDPGCVTAHEKCGPQNDQLAAAGIPMRKKASGGILHWKMILFVAQQQMEFAGANYAPFELTPDTPWVNFTDEIVMFTNDPSLLHSFMTKFDDLWTSTTEFADYANITGPLTRSFPTYPIDPQLNFPPDDSYRTRSTTAYGQERTAIDALMFRITDERQSDAIIAALNRGIPVRLITDEIEYRNPDRLWDSYNVDKMYHAGVQVRLDDHQGINHAKGVLLYSQGMSIFGSSNWTSPSSDSQREHNMFTTQSWIFTWLHNLFDRKWTNGHGTPETKAFVPLPPDAPVYQFPASGATGIATTGVSLSWYAGLWAHNYDIYFGTTATPPLLESNKYLGPSQYSTDYRTYALPPLQAGTTYYWKIVSKTMAFVSADGPVWSFHTAGTAPGDIPPSVGITAPANNAAFTAPATISITASASDSDGTVSRVDFYQGSTLLGSDTTAPYAFSWPNVPAGTYTLTAVATDNGNASTSSAPVTVTVSGAASTLPAGWSDADIGATGAAGGASYSGGTFTVTGAGADVWGSADALHYAWRSMTGDGTIVARVATIQNVNAWTKAGVMIRNSTSPSAAQAFMLVAASSAKGAPFQRRVSDGNTSVSTAGPLVTAPYWVKLVRAGSLITGYASPDGTTWTPVGSDTFTIGSTILIGLGVSSHVAGTSATATFDNVTVTPASLVPPTVSLTSPANGATYTAPASIPLAANASDSDGTVTQVQFFAGSTLLGTDTSSPYGLTWSSVPAGSYTLTAVATDNDGQTTTSSSVTVTVNASSNAPPTVSITSPANNATFAAPASIGITATAADSDGAVAKVDFYNGTTLLGTATTSPYSFTWNNVPAGTYTLSAIATDNDGATTTSSPLSVTVSAGGTLPAGWTHGDIGATGATGAASYSGGTFTVTGAGADVWGSTDAFHYAWQSMTGDGTIIARVASIQNVNAWTKAGVMIRNSTSPSAAQAFMLVAASSVKGVPFQRRVSDGNTSVSTPGPFVTAPYWVKLVRSGNVITGYASPDGSTWTQIGTDTFTMGSTVLIGLGVSSHVAGVNATATFDNVTVTGGS